MPPEKHYECVTCGRKLIDQKSIERGYGPVCWDKHLKAQEEKERDDDGLSVL